MPSSVGSSQPTNQTMSLRSAGLAGGSYTTLATWEAQSCHMIQQFDSLVYIWKKK